MKKDLIFAFLFIPVASFAVPSVRMLGTGAGVAQANNASTVAGTKITPARAATVGNANVPARLGTLRAKSIGASVGGGSGSGAGTTSSRFPVITAAKVYNNVNVPTGQTNSGQNTTIVQGDVNVEEIVNTVTQRVENNYYNKNTIDTKLEEIDNSITNINNNLDDSRFDAIRTVNPREARGVDAPEGYVYIWIEDGQ